MARMARTSAPVSFRTRDALRKLLHANHATKDELIVRCFRVHAAHRGIGYREALDEALCFGWIDGVRHALDSYSFTVRFTPRRAKSYWSMVNTKRYHELVKEGRMLSHGRKVFAARANKKDSTKYSFESRGVMSTPANAKVFGANKRAWAFYQTQPPWYRRTSMFWVMSAKREETRERRFQTLVADCAAGRLVKPLRRPGGSHKSKRTHAP